ncbi:MAG: hypothetical protein ACI4RT_05220 [Candidatus Spyradenecus sp.]
MPIEVITQSLFADSANRPAEWFDANGNSLLQRNVYKVDGVTGIAADGSLSVGQLVMALCLARATKLEDKIIALMNEISENTEKLNTISAAQSDLSIWLAAHTSDTSSLNKDTVLDSGKTLAQWIPQLNALGFNITSKTYYSQSELNAIVSEMDSRMDELNTFSQETMISLQSTTSKRDQAYDMISNILKTLNTTLTGNANNI